MYSNIYLRYLQVITSYINDKIKFSCEQYMYQYCLLETFGLCVDVWMVYMVEEWSGGSGDHSVYHLSCQNSAYGMFTNSRYTTYPKFTTNTTVYH